MKLYFAPQAEADFAAIIGYLAERTGIAASKLSDRIFTIIDKLIANEFDGPEQTLLSGGPQLVGPSPARLLPASAKRLLRIYHQAQQPIVR